MNTKTTNFLKNFDYSKARRGHTVFETDDGEFAWPNCEITGCSNCICVGMSKSLCYPHGIAFGEFTEAEFKKNREDKVTER